MFLSVSPAFCDPNDTFFSKIRSAEAEIQAQQVSYLAIFFWHVLIRKTVFWNNV